MKFVFSTITVAEMMPTRVEDIARCQQQAALLKLLCKGNAMIDIEKLWRLEVEIASGIRSGPCAAFCNDLSWIPKYSHPLADHKFKIFFDSHSYFSDVEWIVKSFGSKNDLTGYFRDYIRKLGFVNVGLAEVAFDKIRSMPSKPNYQFWSKCFRDGIPIIFNDVAKSMGISGALVGSEDVFLNCPGFAATMSGINEYLWKELNSFGTPKMAPSSYPDYMHATYAPYVDIFRADKEMAPHIRKAVGDSCSVVSLSDLPDAIDRACAKLGMII